MSYVKTVRSIRRIWNEEGVLIPNGITVEKSRNYITGRYKTVSVEFPIRFSNGNKMTYTQDFFRMVTRIANRSSCYVFVVVKDEDGANLQPMSYKQYDELYIIMVKKSVLPRKKITDLITSISSNYWFMMGDETFVDLHRSLSHLRLEAVTLNEIQKEFEFMKSYSMYRDYLTYVKRAKNLSHTFDPRESHYKKIDLFSEKDLELMRDIWIF